MDEVAIKVEHVSKVFRLPHEKNSSIKSAVINFYGKKKTYELQKALEDVSFEVKRGEFFGIVGRNGSGKSTLLKMLAGIYAPTKGEIQVNGKLTPFIELGVGFNPELTGRENVFLNGALLGFNRKEVQAMYKDIVDFAELQKFMDQKLKNYSSGMQVRLAFSIAIRAQSDILLLDEVLAVGDAAFQRKCFEYFGTLQAKKQTVVFVTHDMASVRQYCDRVIWIDSGIFRAEGRPAEIVQEYMKTFLDTERGFSDDSSGVPLGVSPAQSIDRDVVAITDVWLGSSKKRNLKIDDKTKLVEVKFKLKALADVEEVVPGVIVTNDLGDFVTASSFRWSKSEIDTNLIKGKSYEVYFKLPNIYERGDHKVSVNVVSADGSIFYDWKNGIANLVCDKEYQTGGKVNPKYEVGIKKL